MKSFCLLSSLFYLGIELGFSDTLELEYSLVVEDEGNAGGDTYRFLDFDYPSEVLAKLDAGTYDVNYRVAWDDGDEWIRFKFDSYSSNYDLLGDGEGLGSSIDIEIIETYGLDLGIFSVGEGFWCKQCASDSSSKYGDTCWGILPSTDTNRGCGCNSGGWTGEGVYYGGWPTSECNVCSCWGGGFSGEKTSGQQKGGLGSVGLEISIIFSVGMFFVFCFFCFCFCLRIFASCNVLLFFFFLK